MFVDHGGPPADLDDGRLFNQQGDVALQALVDQSKPGVYDLAFVGHGENNPACCPPSMTKV